MPYKRKYNKKSNGRPGYIRCGKMVVSDAAKALQMAKYLKTIVNVEFKNHDVQQTAAAVASGGVQVQLSNIAQGDTTITRDGAQCKVVSISLRYTIFMNQSATASSMRVWLIQDSQTNQALFTIADFLEDVTVDDAINSPRNLDNKHRFRVLYDKVHNLSITGRQISSHRFYKKLNVKLRFDNAAAAITSLTQNSLSLLVISDEATNTPAITSFVRLRYVDN